MTGVFEVLDLHCGYAPARVALRRVIERLAGERRTAVLPLSADVGPITLRKNVRVRFDPADERTKFDEVWAVRWESENGGPFPEFRGTLRVLLAPGGMAELEISGQYAPPLGRLGKNFDLVLGQRIAMQSARGLLGSLAQMLEHYCAV